MKKLLIGAFMLASGTALAISPNSSSVFSCKAPSFLGNGNFQYCGANITSSTTATQIGTVSVDPTKSVTVSHRGSLAVSPTLNFLLNGSTVYSLTVSTSTVPQIVNLGLPFYDTVTVSMSTPASISATNAISVTVIENK